MFLGSYPNFVIALFLVNVPPDSQITGQAPACLSKPFFYVFLKSRPNYLQIFSKWTPQSGRYLAMALDLDEAQGKLTGLHWVFQSQQTNHDKPLGKLGKTWENPWG